MLDKANPFEDFIEYQDRMENKNREILSEFLNVKESDSSSSDMDG